MTDIAKPRDLFAADSDVAALVYARGDDPDAVLEAFLSNLAVGGFNAVGLLQRKRRDGTSAEIGRAHV